MQNIPRHIRNSRAASTTATQDGELKMTWTISKLASCGVKEWMGVQYMHFSIPWPNVDNIQDMVFKCTESFIYYQIRDIEVSDSAQWTE